MSNRNLVVGATVQHPEYGSGDVVFVGQDYVGLNFSGSEILMKWDVLETGMANTQDSPAQISKTKAWPENTFIYDDEEAQHYLGSHWDSFTDDSKEIIGRLPEMLDSAVPLGKPCDGALPDGWPVGVTLAWPNTEQGIAMVLRVDADAYQLVSLYPHLSAGSLEELSLNEVKVWEGGLEAQISAGWKGAEVGFFDTGFVSNRIKYRTGQNYQFRLAGIAYKASPAENKEFEITRNPDELAWLNRNLRAGEEPHEATYKLRLDGAAMFMPVSEWDIDDYSFRAPLKSVEAFSDFLGQEGWRVRATVMRFDDEDADLDIWITRHAWAGESAPQVGQDISGTLWLQGELA